MVQACSCIDSSRPARASAIQSAVPWFLWHRRVRLVGQRNRYVKMSIAQIDVFDGSQAIATLTVKEWSVRDSGLLSARRWKLHRVAGKVKLRE
jgi:hypothetical protein